MAKNIKTMLYPKSVAIVGASAKAGSVGNEVLKSVIENKFNGKVYPISLNEAEILGVKCYKSVTEVPGAIDMAVIIVPAKFVNNVLVECGAKKVPTAVIISAGFKEVGGEGVTMEHQIIDTAKKHGITLLGPNCLGAINTNKDVRLAASFAPSRALAGDVGFASQSGALVAGILNILPSLNVGVGHMVSLGNQADVSGADLLEYWAGCDDIKTALLYLEGMENPREFRESAEKITAKKPVVVVKSGRSQEGAKAAASHTGSLAGTDRAAQALFDSCGVIRETSLRDMFNTASVFGKCPTPRGNRVAIVTNSGGPGVLSTDLMSENGLKMAELSKETKELLRANLMPQAAVNNPVDVIASASVEQYKCAIDTVLGDAGVDMALVIYLYVAGRNDTAVLGLLNEAKKKHPNKPIVGVFMTTEDWKGIEGNAVPYFAHVEDAVHGLRRLYERSVYLADTKTAVPTFKVDKVTAKKIIDKAIIRFEKHNATERTLTTYESLEIFRAYGLPLPKYALVNTLDELKTHAEVVGYPAVLKISSYGTSHKSDAGGVVLNIMNYEQLKAAFEDLTSRFDDLEGALLMQQVKASREFVVGVSPYADLRMLMFGIGGIFIEVLNEVNFAMLPLGKAGIDKLTQSEKITKLLENVRGQGAVDMAKLNEMFYRIGQLVSDFANVAELDVNPLMADKQGNIFAVDARICLTN